MALEGFAASKRSSPWETPWGENPLWPWRDLNPRHPDFSFELLRVWCSNQAELQSHQRLRSNLKAEAQQS